VINSSLEWPAVGSKDVGDAKEEYAKATADSAEEDGLAKDALSDKRLAATPPWLQLN
jgi:hypothetical protein